MGLKSLAVAQHLLDLIKSSPRPSATPMKILKMTYIAHGHMLGKHGRPLLDEQVMAYEFGPVVLCLYNAVRHHRSQPIPSIPEADRWTGQFTENEKDVMQSVVEKYAGFDAITLSAAMHKEGTPWRDTIRFAGYDVPISNDLIAHFYNEQSKSATHSAL
jgi:uncharacterized phage-associated protein